MEPANPPLSFSVRAFALVVLVVLLGGMLLLVAPMPMVVRWPWPLGQFPARFLGAIYVAEFVALALLAVMNRWAPGRLVLAMALVFTLVVTLISIYHYDAFNFGRRAPWIWFILYGGSAIVSAWLLWRHRRLSHPGRAPSGGWRLIFGLEAAILCGYGLLMLVAPRTASALWPWPADGFTGRVYSGMFLSAGVGAFLLSRSAAFEDLLTFGLTQVSLALASLAAAHLAKSNAPPSDWEPPSLPWVLGCCLVLAMGLSALEAARRERGRRMAARGQSSSTSAALSN